MKPKIFIASSSENLQVAYAAQEELEYDTEPTVWSQGVFKPSRSAMSSLKRVLDASDFGLFILSPDDITEMRDEKRRTVRDNVIFELGLFAGRLGIERCFLLVPRGAEDLHLPSDLLGLISLKYDANRGDGNLNAAIGPACNKIRTKINDLGCFAVPTSASENVESKAPESSISDSNDCISIIASWFKEQSQLRRTQAIIFSELDTQLNLKTGSAEQYIVQAVANYGYRVSRKGQSSIMFERIPTPIVRRVVNRSPNSWMS